MQTTQNLGYAEARLAIDAIVQRLTADGKAAVVAVADSYGELIALARTDGVPVTSIRIAMNKAWTAARARKPTKEIGTKVRHPEDGFDIAYYGDSRFVGWGGGIPVVRGGAVVGSIAVSGLPQEDDMIMAALGEKAIPGD